MIDVPFERPRAQEMVAEPEFQELVLRAYRGLQVPIAEAGDIARPSVHGA